MIWIAGGLVVGIGAINLALVWMLYGAWQEHEHLRMRLEQSDGLCQMALDEWRKALTRHADRQLSERAQRAIFDALSDRTSNQVH